MSPDLINTIARKGKVEALKEAAVEHLAFASERIKDGDFQKARQALADSYDLLDAIDKEP